MKISEAIEVIKIAKESFREWLVIPLVMLISNTEIKKKKGCVIGFIIYSFKKIHYFAVTKKYRSKGYGSNLIKKVMKKIKYLRVAASNKRAIKFYLRLGFRKESVVNSWVFGKKVCMTIE